MNKTSATVTVEWGYELHSLTLKNKDWNKVQAGEILKMDGEGYHYEGKFFADYWKFNLTEKGSLKVRYGDDGVEGYNGDLSGATIEEH